MLVEYNAAPRDVLFRCGMLVISSGRLSFNDVRKPDGTDNYVDISTPTQNGRLFAGIILKWIFFSENPIQSPIKSVPRRCKKQQTAVVQILPWSQPRSQQLSEPMPVWLLDAWMHSLHCIHRVNMSIPEVHPWYFCTIKNVILTNTGNHKSLLCVFRF